LTGRSRGTRRGRRRRPATLLLGPVCALLWVAPAMAATSAPEVRWEVASEVSPTAASAGAWVNPEGGETSYEIWLECQEVPRGGGPCGPLTDPQRRQGTLPAVSEPLLVTDAFTGLQPDSFYKYRVVATNSVGRSGFVGGGFETVICLPMSLCPAQPYAPGEPLWILEAAERAAQEAPRLEAEREARHREEEERPAKEAAERAAEEREIREAGERVGREQAEQTASDCLVPRLEGDSASAADRALRRARCGVGKVGKPRGRHGRLVVVGQGVPAGRRLPAGTRVALTLGRQDHEDHPGR
jgi:hypothetical protein